MKRPRAVSLCIAIAVASASALAPPSVAAQPTPPDGAPDGDAPAATPTPDDADADRPWAQGVADDERRAALAAFKAGNDSFGESDYAGAARRYREALTHWDHPAIRGNLAVALIHLDQPLEAYEQLEAALRHGAAPFSAQIHEQLLTNRKLLLGQLAQVEVACDVDGAETALDGVVVLAGPGRTSRLVQVGPHQLVARKAGHLTFSQQFTALPRQTVSIVVALVPLDLAGGTERRWAEWKPWAVIAGGAVVAGIGVGLQVAAQGNIDDYEQEIARSCPSGCEPATLPGAVRGLETRGRLENRLAIGGMVAGGTALLAGAVLLYVNRPRRIHLEESGRRVTAAPLLAPGTAGVAVALDF